MLKKFMSLNILILLSAVVLPVYTAEPQSDQDVWKPFQYFIGKWEGRGEGKPGVSEGAQEYQFVLEGKYLFVKNRSTFKPQEKNPKGEVHQDWGFISYDQIRQKFVFRQFHVEGFVNQYVLESLEDKYVLKNQEDSRKIFVFISENIENLPPGYTVRLTYKIINDNEFQQTFDLASPGKEFECYSVGVMKRKSKTDPQFPSSSLVHNNL